jgi:hypothetical protein
LLYPSSRVALPNATKSDKLRPLTHIIEEDWARDFPKFEQKYLASRKPDDPATLQEFINQKDPDYMARWTIEEARALMSHDQLGQQLNI